MDYRPATADELPLLGAFTWQMTAEDQPVTQPLESYVQHFLQWARRVAPTHSPFVAADDAVVGMAWLALVARTPRPGPVDRYDGDLQTVYVLPEHRNRGIGAGLVTTILRHAWDRGLGSVTVSSGRRAVPLYQRVGFTGEPPYLRAFPT